MRIVWGLVAVAAGAARVGYVLHRQLTRLLFSCSTNRALLRCRYKWALSYTAASLLPANATTAVTATRGAGPDAAAAALGAAWQLVAAAYTPTAVRRDYLASIGVASAGANTTDDSDTGVGMTVSLYVHRTVGPRSGSCLA